MEAEAVAEGAKRKTREEAASPVRAGGGPAGKKLATNASPPRRTTQPSAAHPKIPKRVEVKQPACPFQALGLTSTT